MFPVKAEHPFYYPLHTLLSEKNILIKKSKKYLIKAKKNTPIHFTCLFVENTCFNIKFASNYNKT